MTTLKTTVALLALATGLLAIYAVACPPRARALAPNWGIGKRDETIAPLLGVVHPRPGIISH